MKRFVERHTLAYCILAEVLVLGGMMAVGVLVELLLGESGMSEYGKMCLSELAAVALAAAALYVGGCTDVPRKKGVGLGKGLVIGGYYLVVGVVSAAATLAGYEGSYTLRPWYEILAFVICMLLVGAAEELLFRGTLAELLLRHFGRTKNGIIKSVIVSGILFGCAHLTNLGGAQTAGVLVQCVLAGMMGMTFAAIYFRSGNLWVTVLLHAFIDLCALCTTGLFAGSVADVVSGYQPVQLIGVAYYVILLLVLLRKKKMNQMLARMQAEETPRIATETQI